MSNPYFEIGKFVGALAAVADNIINEYRNGDWKKVAIQANQMIAVAHKIKVMALDEESEASE